MHWADHREVLASKIWKTGWLLSRSRRIALQSCWDLKRTSKQMEKILNGVLISLIKKLVHVSMPVWRMMKAPTFPKFGFFSRSMLKAWKSDCIAAFNCHQNFRFYLRKVSKHVVKDFMPWATILRKKKQPYFMIGRIKLQRTRSLMLECFPKELCI